MTSWQTTVLSKLDAYCGFDIDISENHIGVSCRNPESFDVSLHASGDEFQVNFGGWHEHFEAEADALNCFAFGLSEDCRLKVVKRGKMECSWTVQAREDESWIDDTTTGLVFAPFWRSKQIEYRFNIIKAKTTDLYPPDA